MAKKLDRALALLGPLEARIMRAVWSGQVGKAFVVRDVQEHMPELAYTTVMTTLNRLAQKGLLRARPVAGQRAHEYSQELTAAEFLIRSSRDDVQQVIRRHGEAALAAFAVHLDKLSDDQRRRLSELSDR
ncbi:MAG: BlaI/MecI/CopY family transcriptional regulator [Candidatus Dormibacteraeota bacterium]|nr:BlaI/MecI/CopY family transcriptional regulator [Candidatus Dormibacteraeota bacterium]